MWVGAICINQLDLEEKAAQVTSMSSIFKRALQVVVWLGEEEPNTKLAVEFLRWFTAGPEAAVQNFDWSKVEHSKECQRIVPEVVSGIEDVASRNWVRRIWVKQEVWAARELQVCCGTIMLTWEVYRAVLRACFAPPMTIDSPFPKEEDLTRPNIQSPEATCLRNLRRYAEPSKEGPFYDGDVHEILRLLNESTDCQSTKIRDRVYALLGMAGIDQLDKRAPSLGISLTVNLDYKASADLVFRSFAMSIMLYAGAYAILPTDGTFGRRGGLDLPSWTPDFRCRVTCNIPHHWRPHCNPLALQFQLDAFVENRRLRDLIFDITSLVFVLEGHVVATITVSKVVPPEWTKCPVTYSPPRTIGHRSVSSEHDEEHNHNLIPMAVKIGGSGEIDSRITGTVDEWPRSASGKLAKHLDLYDAVAVSTSARSGDVLAMVDTVPIPLFLRQVEETSKYFEFVSCAWLYTKPGEMVYSLNSEIAHLPKGDLSEKEIFRIK